MENNQVFVIILLVLLVILYLTKLLETFVNAGIPTNDDITPKITVGMDYNDSQVSTFPYAPNNLVNAPKDIEKQINKLRNYQPNYDGPNEKPTLDKVVEDKEEFTLMNPIVFNQ